MRTWYPRRVPDEPPRPAASTPLWGDVVRTEDGSLTLHSPRFDQTFRSRHGARREALHVFVEGAGVGERLRAGRPTRVLEIGLGAATNLGQTAALAWTTGTSVAYLAIEREPLPPAAWQALDLAAWAPAPFVTAWLATVETWSHGAPAAARHLSVGPLSIDVWVDDAADLVARPAFADLEPFDAVYLDPFSPEVDPRAWAPEVLAALARKLTPGGVLATYSVQGAVRRALRAAGLEVAKRPGPPGGKREVLRARRPAAGGSGTTP